LASSLIFHILKCVFFYFQTSGKGSTKLLNRIKELEDKSTKGADFIKKLKKKAKELKAKELKAKNVEFEARLDRYVRTLYSDYTVAEFVPFVSLIYLAIT
jgi:hypothetical protein